MSRYAAFEKRECEHCKKMIAGNRLRWHQDNKCEQAKQAKLQYFINKPFGELTNAEHMAFIDLNVYEYEKAEQRWEESKK